VFLAALIPTANREVSPDATLVHRLLQKDVGAFEQPYDRHSRGVYSLVLRILQQAGTTKEVVQDIFLQLWRNPAQYDVSRGPFVPWLSLWLATGLLTCCAGKVDGSGAAKTKPKSCRLLLQHRSTKNNWMKSAAPKKFAL
jgi:hypothetical protein